MKSNFKTNDYAKLHNLSLEDDEYVIGYIKEVNLNPYSCKYKMKYWDLYPIEFKLYRNFAGKVLQNLIEDQLILIDDPIEISRLDKLRIFS